MSFKTEFAMLVGALVLALTPTTALAQGVEYAPAHPAHPIHPTHPTHLAPGPGSPLPEKAKAYGVYCRGFSKKHVSGEKGTPFSRCVTAMAQAAGSDGTSAREACKGFSKKHVAGEKGTPFSRCVVAAAQVRKSEAQR